MSIQEIPLVPNSQQQPIIINNTTYNISVIWRDPFGYFLDILDSTNTPLIQGIPLVTGCDLLGQVKYLNIPGQWIVVSDDGTLTPPTYSNLGITTHLMVVQ